MEKNEEMNRALLLQLIYGYRATQLIYVAAELKIADFLQDGPRNSEYLAKKIDAHEPSLYRVLRALTTVNVFEESAKGFHLTDLSRLLLTETSNPLRAIAIMRGEEVNWKPWGELLYAVKTGKGPFEKVFGMRLFDYYEKHPSSGHTFNEGMNVMTRHDIQFILDSYDFSHTKIIAEIGGGLGRLLFSILAKYPDKHGILYDLPHVINGAHDLMKQFSVENRCKIIGGQFFESIPNGADVYILKRIIHDWDDERSMAILKNCRKVMPNNGRILLCETMIHEDYKNLEGKVNDVHMMVVTGGKERTKKEFSALFEKCGFHLSKIIQASQGLHIIEGICV